MKLRIPIALPALALAFTTSAPLPAAPKNVILFIADGMGFAQVEAAGCFKGAPLSFESMSNTAECTTYSANAAVTDSAAAATAIATGVKVNNGVISMALPGDGSDLLTLLEDAKTKGKETGLITTAYLTHATPAAFGAHESSRANTSQIAGDYLASSLPNVLFGGGGSGLSVTETEGAGYTVVTDKAGFTGLGTSEPLLSAQFGSGYMPYVYQDPDTYPMLDEMTSKAIAALADASAGFFLMVEGGRIDHAGHANLLEECVHETLALADAVTEALNWAAGRNDTLVLVTADHETGGLRVDADNGLGAYPDVTWSSTGHTAANVPVYAEGVNAHLVGGVLDNTDFFDICTIDDNPVTEATNPNPLDGATGVALDAELTWTAGSGAVSHDVYLVAGTDFTDVTPVATTEARFVPGSDLLAGTTYSWRVDELDGQGGTAPGAVWTFTTVVGPGAPTALTPIDGATDVPTGVELSWQPDPLSDYDEVFFGTMDPPTESVLTTATVHDPGSLQPDTTYFWQVVSHNTAGAAASAVQSFTTAPVPPPAEVYASGEASVFGSVAGSLEDTKGRGDGVYEALTEEVNVPNKNGYSTLDHTWTFELSAAASAVFQVIAHHSPSPDGDNFEFSYSTDGETWQTMLTVTKTSDTGSPQLFELPGGLDGTVLVRVNDTDHTRKNQALDTLWVEWMCIEASSGVAAKQYLATAPQPLDGATGVSTDESLMLGWTPGDDASHHDLFLGTDKEYVEAVGTDDAGPLYLGRLDLPSHPLTTQREPLTTYYWRVDELDGAGELLAKGTVWSFTTAPDETSVATTVSASFAIDTVRGSKGMEYVRATVTLRDDLGRPVPDATVTGVFEVDGVAAVEAVSDASGVAVLTSINEGKKPPLYFEVTGVDAGDLVYSP